MSIVESGGPPSWYLYASETGESTKCPWVGVVEGTKGEKNRETVTASLCLVFNGCGRVLAQPQIKSINNFLSWRKNLSDRGNMISIMCGFETFYNSIQEAKLTSLQIRLVSEKKLRRIQRKEYWNVQARLCEAWDKYQNGNISAERLLNTASHLVASQI